MPDYRRAYVPGGTYFFTAVTHQRRPILCTATARQCLHDAIDQVRAKLPFTLVAIVLLPEHLHTVWTLPPKDAAYPLRWKRIKELFTRNYLDLGGSEATVDRSRRKHGERGVWQRRYWEHLVRDEGDLRQVSTMSTGIRKSTATYRASALCANMSETAASWFITVEGGRR
jgi:putative transposase